MPLSRKNQAHNVVLETMKQISFASNHAVIRNANNLLSPMGTDVEVKWVRESGQRSNKDKYKTFYRFIIFYSSSIILERNSILSFISINNEIYYTSVLPIQLPIFGLSMSS